MKGFIYTIFLCGMLLLLSGCPYSPSLNPVIKVVLNGQSLSIIGSGFSHTNPCANISIIGPNSFGNATISTTEACSLGNFNVSWPIAYFGCEPSTGANFTVFAIDKTFSGNGASASVSIPWGSSCAFAAACGKLGQVACPGGCQVGGVDPKSGNCVSCGTEGQPACSQGAQCQAGFFPNGIPAQCTATCGTTNNPPCVTSGAAQNVSNIYSCYNGSTFSSSGCSACVYDPNPNSCQQINSGSTGICVPSVRIPQGCQ
jgi:hypothetical protein